MTFSITATLKAGSKPDYTRVWDDLDKITVVEDFEHAWNRAMMKLTNISISVARGKSPKATNTNPVTVTANIEVLEDGKLWLKQLTEWPNMGDEQQAVLMGMIDGELSMMPGTSRGKQKPQPPKK